jgi:hypothetical protein
MFRGLHTVGHVDDIVYNFRYVLNREAFEVPKRGRSCDPNCFVRRKPSADEFQKLKIVGTIILAAWGDPWNVRRACVIVSLCLDLAYEDITVGAMQF